MAHLSAILFRLSSDWSLWVLDSLIGRFSAIEYKNPSWMSMQDRELSPEGYEFQPGTRLAEYLVEIPTPRTRFPYPAKDSFSPIFFLLGPAWSCETEVSHMGKKPISYRQRWENIIVTGKILHTHICNSQWSCILLHNWRESRISNFDLYLPVTNWDTVVNKTTCEDVIFSKEINNKLGKLMTG